jgi:hypothetical protein
MNDRPVVAHIKLMAPAEWTTRNNLKPYQACRMLIGRRPWHLRGRPVVLTLEAKPGGKP